MVMRLTPGRSNLTNIYYIDANICIFYMRGRNIELRKKMDSIERRLIKIPAIVKAELLVGAVKSAKPEQNIEEVEAFCRPFEIVQFDDSMVMTYAKMRVALELHGQKIGWNDTIIAATALARNGVLVTNNVKEFCRIDGLMYEDWTIS